MDDVYSYFKFRAVNKHLVEALVNPSWYFSGPSQLNDPFDCQLNLERYLEKAASSVTGQAQLTLKAFIDNAGVQKWKRKLSSVGVCAFSLDAMETLLWSHYADQHKGVCLLYRIPESFLLNRSNKIIGVDKVTYGDERIMKYLADGATMEVNEFIKMYLTTKSPSWQYEVEARIIREERGLLRIPGEFLEQVCFVLRTEPADMDLVTKLARAYCGCSKFCRMVRDESNFGFTMVEELR